MPTYDYLCASCGARHEIFQSMTEAPKRKCPACGERALERQIGAGAGILFRGQGFYQTDYRSESYKKAAEAEKPAGDGAAKPESKPEPSKPDKPAKGEKSRKPAAD